MVEGPERPAAFDPPRSLLEVDLQNLFHFLDALNWTCMLNGISVATANVIGRTRLLDAGARSPGRCSYTIGSSQ